MLLSPGSPMQLSPLLSPGDLSELNQMLLESSISPRKPQTTPKLPSPGLSQSQSPVFNFSSPISPMPGLLTPMGPPVPISPPPPKQMVQPPPVMPSMMSVSQRRPRNFFAGNIERATLNNNAFRRVAFTGPKHQIVLMALQAGENIGAEIHVENEQFFRIEEGTGVFRVKDEYGEVNDIPYGPGDIFDVTPGTAHDVIARTQTKLYTIYSPPHHPDGTIHQTKNDASAGIAGF